MTRVSLIRQQTQIIPIIKPVLWEAMTSYVKKLKILRLLRQCWHLILAPVQLSLRIRIMGQLKQWQVIQAMIIIVLPIWLMQIIIRRLRQTKQHQCTVGQLCSRQRPVLHSKWSPHLPVWMRALSGSTMWSRPKDTLIKQRHLLNVGFIRLHMEQSVYLRQLRNPVTISSMNLDIGWQQKIQEPTAISPVWNGFRNMQVCLDLTAHQALNCLKVNLRYQMRIRSVLRLDRVRITSLQLSLPGMLQPLLTAAHVMT